MHHHDSSSDDDDALASRLRRAAAAHRPPVPADLAARTLATVQRERRRSGVWWRSRAWLPLLAASLMAAVTLGLTLGPGRAPAAANLDLSLALSPWQSLPELPLHQEWRSLQQDADHAAQVLVACLPRMHDEGPSGVR